MRQRQRQCCVTVSLDYLVLSNHDKAFRSLIWPQGATFHQHRLLCGESKRSDELQRLKIDKKSTMIKLSPNDHSFLEDTLQSGDVFPSISK